jgi:hypothetical protein
MFAVRAPDGASSASPASTANSNASINPDDNRMSIFRA